MSLEPDPKRTDDPIEAVARFITAAGRLQAAQLKARREEAGLTQEQLARRVDFSRSTVANAEAGNMKASAEFWQRADRVLNANGVLAARYLEMQNASRRHAELLARKVEQQHEADVQNLDERSRLAGVDIPAQPDEAEQAAAHDSITGAGLRISAAVLDLLAAVHEGVRPDRAANCTPLRLSRTTLDALHEIQEETGHSPSKVAEEGIRLYCRVRALLASGAEILIRAPGTEDRPMQL
jgi:transcriptional regulator with XRE-family HTH domain